MNWKVTLTWLATVAVVAGASSYFMGVSFWIAAAIAAVALVINGIVAEIEDRSPGGFLNPKDDE